MTYIIKRKLQGVLGDDVDTNEMSALLQHTQDSAVEYIVNQDSLTVNNLVVKKTNKIPVGTDKYPPANPSSTAIGAVIETRDIISNNYSGTYNCIKLSDGFYMLAFTDNDQDGQLVTFAVTESTGDIGGNVDTWEYNPNETNNSTKIIKISGTTYAITYSASQTANAYYVKTFTVSDAGVITKSFIDSLTIPTTNDEPVQHSADFLHISGDVYAIVYTESGPGAANPGVVASVSITSAGTIGNSVIDSLTFTATSKEAVSIVRVGTTDFYAIAFENVSRDPVVVTVDIDSAGTIANAVTDTQVLGATNAHNTGNIVRVPGTDFYAVPIGFSNSSGRIYVVSINSSGAITIKGYGFFDTNDAEQNNMIAVRDDLFAIVYRGVDNDGFIVTVPINSDGTVGLIADSLEFDTADVGTPNILSLGGNKYIITYGTFSFDDIRGTTLTITPSVENAGFTWNEDSNLRSFDADGVERKYIHTDDVDDTPVNGATTDPISSNWAFDHEAAADPHTGYVLESLFDAQTVIHATSDDTPVALTVTEQTLVGRQTGGNIAAVPIGITDDDIVEIDDAGVAAEDFGMFTANGLKGVSIVTYEETVVINQDTVVYV